MWTWNPLEQASFYLTPKDPAYTLHAKNMSILPWTWTVNKHSNKFLLVIINTQAWCIHLSDGTVWATSPPTVRLGSAAIYQNKVIGLDDSGLKLTEYELPSFHKVRAITFQMPVSHVHRPANHVLVLSISGLLSQFYLHTHKWGVKYKLGGKTTLRKVYIDGNLILAVNKHVLLLLSLSGRLLGKVSAIRGNLVDCALVRADSDGVEVVLVEQVHTKTQVQKPGNTDRYWKKGGKVGAGVGDGESKELREHMDDKKCPWIARLAKITWRSRSSRKLMTGPSRRWVTSMDARDRICHLREFSGLITIGNIQSSNSNKGDFRTILAFGPTSVCTLQNCDFTPV